MQADAVQMRPIMIRRYNLCRVTNTPVSTNIDIRDGAHFRANVRNFETHLTLKIAQR